MQQGMVKALGEKPKEMSDPDWKELETKAVSTIRLCLADEVMVRVIDEESPAAVWTKLESHYMSKSLTNKLFLKQKLYGLKMGEGSDLRQHINTFNQTISDLQRVGVKFEDEDKSLMLLNSLPASYENLSTTLTWGKESLELEEITGALLAFNLRKKTSEEGSQGEGLVVKGNQERGRSKSRFGGHNNSRSKSRNKKSVQCYKCGKRGHIRRDCPERHKSSDDNKVSGSKSVNVVEDDSDYGDGDMLSVSSTIDNLADSWILDSACSYHMTPYKEWFDTYRLVNSGSVLMGNDASCKVIGIGTVRVKMFDGVVRTLSDVRHIPELRKNLISLGTLDSHGYCYKSEGGQMKIIKGVMVVMKGDKLSGNIYRLLGTTVVGGAASVESESNSTVL